MGKQSSLLPALRACTRLPQPFPSGCQDNAVRPSPTMSWDQPAYAIRGPSCSPYRLHCNKGQGCRGLPVLSCLPFLSLSGSGREKARQKRKTTSAVPTACRGEILDCSIVTSWCVTGSTSSSNHAGEDQAYSHRYSASTIQPSSPFISLIKGRKPLSRGSEGNLALCLHVSPCTGTSRT